MRHLCIYIRVAFRVTHILIYTEEYSHVGIIGKDKQDAYSLYSFGVIEEHNVHHHLHLWLSSCR